MSSFVSWLKENRINPSANVLRALEDLGATELSDLLDLEEDDIMAFQAPLLKKLEFVRFKRGIETLRANSVNMGVVNIDSQVDAQNSKTSRDLPPSQDILSVPTTISTSAVSDTHYEYPPLPSSCPEKGCAGTLSCALGKRRNKNLIGLQGPDFRWIVSCSQCSVRWHACHFLCGHIARISPMGSSDIIRHEMGRFNRWQKKIKPPCVNNPQNRVLKAGYNEERTQYLIEEERRKISIQDKDKTAEVTHQQQALNGTWFTGEAPGVDHSTDITFDDAFISKLTSCSGAPGPHHADASLEEGSNPKRVRLNNGDAHSSDEVKPSDSVSEICCEIEKLIFADFEANATDQLNADNAIACTSDETLRHK